MNTIKFKGAFAQFFVAFKIDLSITGGLLDMGTSDPGGNIMDAQFFLVT